jgi:large subunit ribosomal protein L21
MYAIVQVGGKQYSVKEKDIIEVEKQEAKEGKDITLDNILLVSSDDGEVHIGRPFLKNAKIVACVLKQIKAKKVLSYKYRRRKASHWKKGHRQQLSRLEIKLISIGLSTTTEG